MDAEDDYAKADADLGGGEAGAVEVSHGVPHVLEERLELGGVELLNREGFLPEAGIAHA